MPNGSQIVRAFSKILSASGLIGRAGQALTLRFTEDYLLDLEQVLTVDINGSVAQDEDIY